MVKKPNLKTEIRVNINGYEVWYSVDGGKTHKFRKSFESMDDAVKETVSMKGHIKLLGDILKKL